METNLLDPKEVLANEAFPRDSPRPDFLDTLDRLSPLFVPGWFKKLGVGKGSDFRENQTTQFPSKTHPVEMSSPQYFPHPS